MAGTKAQSLRDKTNQELEDQLILEKKQRGNARRKKQCWALRLVGSRAAVKWEMRRSRAHCQAARGLA